MNNLSFTQNRELSWLKFNERVLDETGNSNVPILERLKFFEIYTSNLDEFFMVRVGSLYNLDSINPNQIDLKSNMTPKQQIKCILNRVKILNEKKINLYNILLQDMNKSGIHIKKYNELNDSEKKYIKKVFKVEILPFLSPSIIDISHPFPLLENKVSYLMVEIKKKDAELIGIVEITNKIPGFFNTNEGNIVFFEDIIYELAEEIFKNYKLISKNIISVTRNADISLNELEYDEELDLIDAMKGLLKKRNRLKPVRLEAKYLFSKSMERFLLKKLELLNENIFICEAPLQLKFIYSLIEKYPCKYFYSKFNHRKNSYLNENEKIIPQIAKHDALLFYPYDSMAPFLKLIKEAACDPNTISISITIYRLGSKSKLVDYLIMAAENGITVTCLVELRARFDEKNNIDFASRLEDSGCRVIYGFDNYKVHSKICLIKRKTKNNISYITQVGTGNYNEKTANIYTDYSYITANHEIGNDASIFFKNMLLGNLDDEYKHLLVSPKGLKAKVIDMIDEEAKKGTDGYIFFKVNSITDLDVINHLSLASQEGCRVKMIVRGICCLLPNVLGNTDNIEIHSIVGRFLEHSRIYQFGKGYDSNLYVASADMMTRNTTRRVEIAVPILSKSVKKDIIDQIEIMLSDNVNGRIMDSEGNYNYIQDDKKIDSHQYFMNLNVEKKETKNNFKTIFLSTIKSKNMDYKNRCSFEILGYKHLFDLKVNNCFINFADNDLKVTARNIEKWFFINNQLKKEGFKFIIAFNIDKNLDIINKLNRIGVSCIFKNTYDEFIRNVEMA